MKRYILLILIILNIGMLVACGGSSDGNIIVAPKGDVITDICKQFDGDFIYSATGKPIVKVAPSTLPTVYACNYYTDYKEDFYKDKANNFSAPGGPNILIVLDNLSVATNKKGTVEFGGTIHTDDRIPMEHYIVRRTDGSIWNIKLVINPNRFVTVNQLNNALTEEELINLTAKMAQRIQGKKLNITKNPGITDEAKEETKSEVKSETKPESQEALVRTFFENIGGKKIDDALKMMDANEETKQMWGVNFNTLDSLTVKSIEPTYQEEWTADRVTYQIELDAKVNSEQYGWSNGMNTRWVSVQKQGNDWVIHELANNP